jgi:hypothetical protein
MHTQYPYIKFYYIQGGAWDEAMLRYNNSVIQEFQELRSILTAFGFESTSFELEGKTIHIWPTANDERNCWRVMKKKRDGSHVIRRRSFLYRELNRRKKEMELLALPYPRPENFFTPAYGLTCELTHLAGVTYLIAKAFVPFETEHFTEIPGSEYYAAFHNFYLMREEPVKALDLEVIGA